MDIKEYLRPQQSELSTLPLAFRRFFLDLVRHVNKNSTLWYELPEYVDNAAAVSGGLATGQIYYDTTLEGPKAVT